MTATMLVDIYEMPNDLPLNAGPEHGTPGSAGVDLRECFPDDEGSYDDARQQIDACGRTWVGGGAAPLFLITLAK